MSVPVPEHLDRSGSHELGVVHESSLNEKLPLSTAVQFIDDFIRRDKQYPELKDQIGAARHEFYSPSEQNTQQSKPFTASSVALPKELEALDKKACGVLPSLEMVWIASGSTAYLWNYKTMEPYKVFEDMEHEVTAIFATTPKPDVFVESVKHLIVVTTTHALKIYAVASDLTFFDSGFTVKHSFSGIPKFADVKNRIIFAAGTTVYEVEYRAKESWFRSKVQLHQASAGTAWFGHESETGIKQVSVDHTRHLLYTLNNKGIVAVYDFSNGIRYDRTLPAQKNLIVGISAISKHQSYTEVLVLINTAGERIYLQDSRSFRVNVTKEAPIKEPLTINSCSVVDRDIFVSVQSEGLFLSAVDSARLMHLVDQHSALAFPEASAIHPIKDVRALALISPPQSSYGNEAALQYSGPPQEVAALTGDSVHFIRRTRFYERFLAEGTLPAHITRVYGHIEVCCAALCVATRPNVNVSKVLRDAALNSYYRFGGIPVFQKDIEANRYTYLLDATNAGAKENTEVGIRLSSSFDGLACYTSRLLESIWSKTLFSYKRNRDNSLSDVKLNVNRTAFEAIHSNLIGLSAFLESSKPIDTKLQYSHAIGDTSLLSQAEQKSVAAMAQLVKSAQQGIAFLLLLESETSKSNTGLEGLLAYVSKDISSSLMQMTFRSFFTEAKYSEVTRELVTCLINFIINRGDSIDSVARIIQDRCETYCSASDVLVYKALQYIHSSKSSPENDLRIQKLYKSAGLFVKAAANISFDTLKDIVSEYVSMEFYPGSVAVTLAAAAEVDRANVALGYLRDGQPENDARQKIYTQKTKYFDLIFDILEKVPLKPDSEVYKALNETKDEVFAYYLYDWLLNNRIDLLSQLDTPYIQGWLQNGAKRDARIAELLWKHYLRQNDLLAAADVLLNIAKGTLKVPMMQRVELLSRAMGYCKCQFPQSQQQQVFELGTMVNSYLKIANVQSEILHRVEGDASVSPEQQQDAVKGLNSQLLTVTELFNEYAQRFHYYDICLSIFEIADFTDPTEVMQCYERLLDTVRFQDAAEGAQHYAHVSSLLVSLGRRFAGVNSLFPVGQLYPYLQRYAEQYCPDAPYGWVLDTFTKSGTPASALV